MKTITLTYQFSVSQDHLLTEMPDVYVGVTATMVLNKDNPSKSYAIVSDIQATGNCLLYLDSISQLRHDIQKNAMQWACEMAQEHAEFNEKSNVFINEKGEFEYAIQ